jgi:hypothetical protein
LAAVTTPSTSDPEIGHSWSSHALHQQQSLPLLKYWVMLVCAICKALQSHFQTTAKSLFKVGGGWTVLSHFQWNLWSSQACLWTNAIFLWTWTETWCTSDHYDRVLNYNIVEILHILQCKIADCCGIAEIRADYQIAICRCGLLLKIFVAGKCRCIIYSWISFLSFFPQVYCPQLRSKNHCHCRFSPWS